MFCADDIVADVCICCMFISLYWNWFFFVFISIFFFGIEKPAVLYLLSLNIFYSLLFSELIFEWNYYYYYFFMDMVNVWDHNKISFVFENLYKQELRIGVLNKMCPVWMDYTVYFRVTVSKLLVLEFIFFIECKPPINYILLTLSFCSWKQHIRNFIATVHAVSEWTQCANRKYSMLQNYNFWVWKTKLNSKLHNHIWLGIRQVFVSSFGSAYY